MDTNTQDEHSIQRNVTINAPSSNIDQVVGNQHNYYNDVHYYAASNQQFDLQILDKLRPANMDPYGRPQCLEGTRTGVVQNITDWVLDPYAVHNILWLYGLAGAGKSTISTTIANRFNSMGHLGAFLFFDRDVTERSDPASVVRTLAYQAGLFIPSLGRAIASSLEKFPAVTMSPPSLQFQRLIVEPLASIHTGEPRGSSAIVFVLDALDECGTPHTRQPLLQILADSTASLSANVRFIITSRPERDIDIAFRTRPRISALELDITLDDNMTDISAYLHHELASVRKNIPVLKNRAIWPTEAESRKLVERASGLFVWASTAIKFIDRYDPQKRLEVILSGSTVNGAQNALDALYRTALEAAGDWDDEDFVSVFRAVFGLILALRQPLSSTSIDLLLGSNHSSCKRIIEHLGCVIQQNPTVRLLHPSFGDFLRTPSRNLRAVWSFEGPDHNTNAAINMLQHLCRTLKRNMCNMTLSANPDGEKLSADLTYACLFWVDHVCAIENNSSVIMKDLDAFIFVHLLHWFEAMSILRQTRSAISMLDDLHDWLSTHSPSLPIIELVAEAVTFAQTFVSTLEEHPLLLYHSALPFTPHSSAIYKVYKTTISSSVIPRGFQRSWPSYSLVLSGHVEYVQMAMFSPDGRSIASFDSSYEDLSGTIRVWDTKTGEEHFPPLRHDNTCCLAFSFDSLRILSVSFLGLLRMWDATSGVEVLPPLQLDDISLSPWILAGAFSPDRMKFAYGTVYGYIRVIHFDPHVQLRQLTAFSGCDLAMYSISFSLDGERIVSGFDDGSIRVYHVASELETVSTMRGHSEKASSVAFSPDGTRIVSGSFDKTIRVWSIESGLEIFSPLRAHTGVVTSAVFSPDGAIIVSSSWDGTIRVWNAMLGVEIHDVPRDHIDNMCHNAHNKVNSVALSPDGKSIVSASDDNTVRVWKMSAGSATIPHAQRDRLSMYCFALSPDGTKVASTGSEDGTISIWDAKHGTETFPPFRKHKDKIASIIFSPDGTQIFSCTLDNTLRAWDIITGVELFPAIQNNSFRLIALCSLRNQIASVDRDDVIRKWDAKLGVEIRFSKISPVRHHDDSMGVVGSVVFSLDGTMIATLTWNTIRILDANSGAMILLVTDDHRSSECIGFLSDIAFSMDGSIVYGFESNESPVHVWTIPSTEGIDGIEDFDGGENTASALDMCSRLFSQILVTEDGWLVDLKTMRTLSQIPSFLRCICLVFVGKSESLAFETEDGEFYVMHFSKEVFNSSETRPVERNFRLNVKNHGPLWHGYESDSDGDSHLESDEPNPSPIP